MSGAPRGPGPLGRLWELPELWLLPTVVAALFVFRFLILREIPYPPSGDAAGDLVWLHTYQGHPLAGYGISQAPPPVYFFVAVLPATSLAGTFTGIQAIMALIPALFVVPTFYLMRWSGFARPASLVASVLLAGSSAFSEMIAWNSAFNATGILFLLAFLAFLVRGERHRGWAIAIAAGAALALVAGSHVVTFLYGVTFFASYVVLECLRRAPGWRARFAFFAKVAVAAAIGWLPFAVNYYDNFVITANVGPPSNGSSWQELVFVYSQSLAFPWGSNTPIPTWNPTGVVVLVDMLLTVVALALVWQDARNRGVAQLTTALFAASLVIAALDPGNAIRAVYFLPVAYIPALVAWASRWQPRSWPELALGPPGEPLRRQLSRPRSFLLGSAAAVFLVANLMVSGAVLQQSEQFYLQLDSEKVAALQWIAGHTPANATFYDAANLQTWILGFADRLAYSPGHLTSKVTKLSYDQAIEANLIDLGAYVLGNSRLYVTSNVPGVYNSPGIYVRTNDFSAPLWLGESDTTVVRVDEPGGVYNLTLSYGQRIHVAQVLNGSGPTASASGAAPEVEMSTEYGFPSADTTITESFRLSSSAVTIGFTATNGTVASVSATFRTPPSGYFYDYPSFPTERVVGSLNQTLILPFLGAVELSTSAPGLAGNVSTESNGWSQMNLTMAGPISFNLTGYGGVGGVAPFYSDTLDIARSLGIHYFVISSLTDYPLFERFFAMVSQGYLVMPTVYTTGNIAIRELP